VSSVFGPRLLMATLLQVATSLVAVNREAAREYILKLGDRLRLLSIVLRFIAAPCVAHAQPVPEAPPDDAPLFEISVSRPRNLHAYVEAILRAAEAQMPGVDPSIFAELRMWNALLWSCGHVESSVVTMIFWWIATAHRGVFDMVLATEPPRSWWRFENRYARLCHFVEWYVARIGKSDVSLAVAHARSLHAVLSHFYTNHPEVLLRPEHCPLITRIPQRVKETIRRAHTVNDAPPTLAAATMEYSS